MYHIYLAETKVKDILRKIHIPNLVGGVIAGNRFPLAGRVDRNHQRVNRRTRRGSFHKQQSKGA